MAGALDGIGEAQPTETRGQRSIAAPVALDLSGDATWFRVSDGAVVDIPRRRLLRSLLLALATFHRDEPGRSLSTAQLVDRVWPGDRSHSASARNRLYFAVNALRRLGLRGIVVRSRGGYALATDTVVSFR